MYTREDILRGMPRLSRDVSIFTSPIFRAMNLLLGYPSTLLPNNEASFWKLAPRYASLMSPYYIGLSTTLPDVNRSMNIDPTNFQLYMHGYLLCANDGFPCYFPTEEVVDALSKTRLTWVDRDAFAKLPDIVTVTLPKENVLRMFVGDEVMSLDDLMFTRIKHPDMRRQTICNMERNSGKPCSDDAEVWHWLAQSRIQIHDGIQNSMYGELVIDRHMKLEDVLAQIRTYYKSAEDHVRHQYDSDLRHLTDAIQRERASFLASGQGDVVESAQWIAQTLSAVITEDRMKIYISIVEFFCKVVLMLDSEGLELTPMPIPGMKEQKKGAKAKAIQQKLRWRYGYRYKITLPPLLFESGSHASPVRHLVSGHFKSQPYGPGNALRKTIWRHPFWRGEDKIVK